MIGKEERLSIPVFYLDYCIYLFIHLLMQNYLLTTNDVLWTICYSIHWNKEVTRTVWFSFSLHLQSSRRLIV